MGEGKYYFIFFIKGKLWYIKNILSLQKLPKLQNQRGVMDSTQHKKRKSNPFIVFFIRIFVCVSFATLMTFFSFPTNLILVVVLLLVLYVFQRVYVSIRWEQKYGIPYSQRHDYKKIMLKRQELKAQRLEAQKLEAQRLAEQMFKAQELQNNSNPDTKKRSHRNDYRKKRKMMKKMYDNITEGSSPNTYSINNQKDYVDTDLNDRGDDNNFLDTLFNVDGDSSASFFIFDTSFDGGGDGGDFGSGCDGGGDGGGD